MKLHEHFKTFLKDHVNLNETRLGLLTNSVSAVQDAIELLEWGPEIVDFGEQGSWAHETIIKPKDGKPFDADMIVFVKSRRNGVQKTMSTNLRHNSISSRHTKIKCGGSHTAQR